MSCSKVVGSDIKRAGEVIDKAFATTKFQDFLVKYCKNIPLHEKLQETDFENVLGERIEAYHKVGADIVEADDFVAVAAWFKPGLNPPLGGISEKFFTEYNQKLAALEQKHGMENREDWHLMLIGRDPTQLKKGSIRKLFEPYLEKAREEKVGASLEAISEHAVKVYEHFGFRVVDKFHMGEGQIGADGKPNPNGEGLSLYFMVYE